MDQLLRPLKSENRFEYCVFDIEAIKWTNLTHVGFYDGFRFVMFRSMKRFVRFFMRRKYAGWRCFAHFGGGYDFNFLLESLEDFPEYGYQILSNAGISLIKVTRRSKNLCQWFFVDSYKLLPKSLHDLTHSFNVEHKKLSIDVDNLENEKDCDIVRYLSHDCMGLYEVLQSFEGWFRKRGVPMKTTIASQAMATYRRTMPFSIPVLKPAVETFVRKSYCGGRVEVFKMRCTEPLHVYDFSSLYPYCMKKYAMPIGRAMRVQNFVPGMLGFYSARIVMPKTYLPSMPFKTQAKLLFPCGTWKGVFSSIEIEKARELGAQVQTGLGYVFSREFIFDDYVDEFFNLKSTSTGATRELAKLLLNSLYGKWAQGRKKEMLFKASDVKELIGTKPYDEEHNLWMKTTMSRATFIIPSLSAWITSCARIELLNAMNRAGEDNIYYVDTDSVFSTKRLPTGDQLGALKLEQEVDDAIFLQPKMYMLRSGEKLTIKAKGFEKEFVHKLSYQNFENALYGNKTAFVQEVLRFGKFRESLRRNHNFVSMIRRKKSIQSFYDKRNVLKNFDTEPLTVEK